MELLSEAHSQESQQPFFCAERTTRQECLRERDTPCVCPRSSARDPLTVLFDRGMLILLLNGPSDGTPDRTLRVAWAARPASIPCIDFRHRRHHRLRPVGKQCSALDKIKHEATRQQIRAQCPRGPSPPEPAVLRRTGASTTESALVRFGGHLLRYAGHGKARPASGRSWAAREQSRSASARQAPSALDGKETGCGSAAPAGSHGRCPAVPSAATDDSEGLGAQPILAVPGCDRGFHRRRCRPGASSLQRRQ